MVSEDSLPRDGLSSPCIGPYIGRVKKVESLLYCQANLHQVFLMLPPGVVGLTLLPVE